MLVPSATRNLLRVAGAGKSTRRMTGIDVLTFPRQPRHFDHRLLPCSSTLSDGMSLPSHLLNEAHLQTLFRFIQTQHLTTKDNLALLNEQRLKRPNSPHLTIYQPQVRTSARIRYGAQLTCIPHTADLVLVRPQPNHRFCFERSYVQCPLTVLWIPLT
jgi:hypothetical protein